MHRQMINSTLIYFAMIVLQALLQIVLLPLQTHFLSPSQYGVLATVIACAIILSPIFNLGLHGAAQRFSVDYKEDSPERNRLWTTLLLLSLVVGLGMGVLTLVIISLLPTHFWTHFISLSYLSVAIVHAIAMGAVLVGSELLRMAHQPRRYAMAMTIMSLAYLFMNIIFIGVFHWGLVGALVAFGLMPWFGFLAILLNNHDYYQWPLQGRLVPELLAYSLKLMPHFTFTTLNTVADRLLLAFILGQHFTGIYTAGTTMASVMLMITSAIGFSARPQIFSRLAQNTAASLSEVRALTITAMLIIALAGANLSLWSPEALALLTSSAFHSAWQITILLTLKYMLQSISLFVLSSILFNKVKVHRLLWVALSSFLLLIFFSTQLAPHFGIWGIAIAGLMATLYELFFNVQLSKKAFQLRWPVGRMLGLISVFFIPACALVFFTQSANTALWLTISIKLLFSIGSVFLVVFMILRQQNIEFHPLLSAIVPWRALKPRA